MSKAVASAIDLYCGDPENYEDGEPPTPPAIIAKVKDIVQRAACAGIAIPTVGVSAFYGDLSLTWNNGNRMVRLQCSPPDHSMRLYFGEAPLGPMCHYDSHVNPTALYLAEKLGWLTREGEICQKP